MDLSKAAEQTKTIPAPRRGRLPRLQEAGLLVVIVLLGLLLSLLSEPVFVQGKLVNNFFRLGNVIPNVFTPMSWMAIMAIGVTFVIITGGIDISIGSIFGLSALATAYVLEHFDPNASAWVVLPAGIGTALGVGLLCGLINGLLIVGLRLHSFIVTLGTLSIFRGIAAVAPQQFLHETQSLPSFGRVLPQAFTDHFMMYSLRYGSVDLQPMPMLIMIGCLMITWVYLQYSVWGRQIYAVGGNEQAARFSGLPVNRIKIRVYAFSGLAAGLAGMISAGFYGAADTATGIGYELMVIAAAVVGGASLSGGRGTAFGAVLGALVIQMIQNGIFVLHDIRLGGLRLHLSKEYSLIIIGTAIIVAVAIDRFSENFRERGMLGGR